jgi:hypothetical protein
VADGRGVALSPVLGSLDPEVPGGEGGVGAGRGRIMLIGRDQEPNETAHLNLRNLWAVG